MFLMALQDIAIHHDSDLFCLCHFFEGRRNTPSDDVDVALYVYDDARWWFLIIRKLRINVTAGTGKIHYVRIENNCEPLKWVVCVEGKTHIFNYLKEEEKKFEHDAIRILISALG